MKQPKQPKQRSPFRFSPQDYRDAEAWAWRSSSPDLTQTQVESLAEVIANARHREARKWARKMKAS